MKSTVSELWTIQEVADFLKVKTSVVKYWLQTSYIPFVKVGKHYRFDSNDIRAWMERHKNNCPEGDLCLKQFLLPLRPVK